MSLKMKLVSCVSAFIIVASLMLISVFAATNVTLNIGGNVTFQAVGVQATISQGVVANGTVADSASKMQAVTIDSENDGATALATWSGLELSFNEDGDPMTITFDITNNHTERDLEVTITNSIGTASNATMSVTSTSDDPVSAIVIPAKTSDVANSETITITFSVQDPDLSASIEGFTVGVEMTNSEGSIDDGGDEVNGYKLTFNYDVSSTEVMVDATVTYMNGGTENFTIANIGGNSGEHTFTGVKSVQFFGQGSGAPGDWYISITSDKGYSGGLSFSGRPATSDSTEVITLTGPTTFTISG